MACPVAYPEEEALVAYLVVVVAYLVVVAAYPDGAFAPSYPLVGEGEASYPLVVAAEGACPLVGLVEEGAYPFQMAEVEGYQALGVVEGACQEVGVGAFRELQLAQQQTLYGA